MSRVTGQAPQGRFIGPLQGQEGGLWSEDEPAGKTQPAASWYAVQVKRQCEVRVVRHLSLKAVANFLPFVEVARRQSARRSTELEPLFPGYVFARLGPLRVNPAGWHAVRWSPGVRMILGTGETPVPVPDEVMEAIQDRISELGFVRPSTRFKPGARVWIRTGPFAGLEAVFDRPMGRAGRVRILLELLGQARVAEVDELDLESA